MPDFVAERLTKFNALRERHAASQPTGGPFTVTLPDGKTTEIPASFTALDVAKQVVKNKKVYSKFLAAVRDDEVIDMSARLGKTCKLEFLTFDDPRAREVFWHSSAHLLGYALEKTFQAHLGHGPAIDSGFFYDAFFENSLKMEPESLLQLDKAAAEIVKQAAAAPGDSPVRRFTRLEVTKQEALDLFSYSKLKSELISDHVQDGEMCSVYQCGNFVDFCRGPHIPDLGLIQAFKCMYSSAAYFKGDQNRESMQRVYAVAFPSKDQLDKHIELLEEAKRRDHRNLAKEMDLFMTHKYAPGAPMFMNNGTRIYRKLEAFIRELLHEFDYEEVMTPTFLNTDLWGISGHLQHYKENMFLLERKEKTDPQYGLKPMNCPCHCLLYKNQHHSVQELPIRMAEFGVVHRNELSGALSGLTRVVRFEQDDAHIFCTVDQIEQEMTGLIEFIKRVYTPFGIDFALSLSLRPEKKMGSDELWDRAEGTLRKVLTNTGLDFKENPGDGAFYGPKIDVHLTDALGRQHQCGTIQLDFNLPSKDRFDLLYSVYDEKTGSVKQEHPVMIHRAILGSVERFMAILIENTGGRFPFWISPRQIVVIPLHGEDIVAYAKTVRERYHSKGYFVDLDISSEKMEKKIAVAWNKKYNFIMVVGAQEKGTCSVALSGRTLSAYIGEKDNQRARKVLPLEETDALLAELSSGRANM
ncbi:Threonyl-tRNA synthetase [Giardia duodenalis]|uniref:threonine--tRNA ligase n=1 Tax=Giardia intestinalis TaxID=5741 RepID=V6TD26_GIAIN|nr:Threonyl-tRNA synthetase [Giardia intestinalis]